MIKAIVSDVGKVVINFSHKKICEGLSEYSPYSWKEIYEIILKSELGILYDKGKISNKEFYKKVKEKINLNLDYDAFVDIWLDTFFISEEDEKVRNLFKKLKGKYKLIALSNTDELHMDFLKKEFDVMDIFDDYVFSYEIGFVKPDEEIYLEALKKADAKPKECVYIDDIKEYSDKAISLGINGIHFKNFLQLKNELEKLGVKV